MILVRISWGLTYITDHLLFAYAKKSGLKGDNLIEDPVGGAFLGLAMIGSAPYRMSLKRSLRIMENRTRKIRALVENTELE